MKRKQGFSSILFALILLVIVFTAMSFIIVKTESFTTPIKSFYVSVGDDDIYSNRELFEMSINKSYTFEIKDNLNLDSSNSNYSISIIPNKDITDFNFKGNGKDISFHSVNSLSAGFSVTYNDNEFTLTPLYDLDEVLGMLYDNVMDVPTDIKAYYRLVIDSNSTTDSIYINLLVNSYEENF